MELGKSTLHGCGAGEIYPRVTQKKGLTGQRVDFFFPSSRCSPRTCGCSFFAHYDATKSREVGSVETEFVGERRVRHKLDLYLRVEGLVVRLQNLLKTLVVR